MVNVSCSLTLNRHGLTLACLSARPAQPGSRLSQRPPFLLRSHGSAVVLACVIVRLSVAALGARMRSPAQSCVRPHPRTSPAGSSRKLRSRKFDVKFKSGLFPEFQVRLIRP